METFGPQSLKKILIVEDEEPVAKAIQLKLEREGLAGVIARDGQEALDIFSQGGISLVLLDLILPKRTGFEVLGEIRKKDPQVPVIAVSNLSQEEDRSQALQLGANAYFVKSDTQLKSVVGYVLKLLK